MSTSAGNITITVSIGAVCGPDNLSVDAMIAAADTFLYKAKKEGRNRAIFASISDSDTIGL